MRRDFIISAFGVCVGQLIVLLSTPVLSRIYSPSQFGSYATLVALSAIIATGASLRLDIAIPALSDSEVKHVSLLAYVLPFISVTIVCFVFPTQAFNFLPFLKGVSHVPVSHLWAISCLQGMTTVVISYCTRQGNFTFSAAIKIIQPAFFVLAALCWRGIGLEGALVIGWLAASLLGATLIRKLPWRDFSGKTFKVLIDKWEFPVVSLPVALLDVLSLSLPLLFIVSVYGAATGGNYSQVQRLVAAPLLLAGLSISQVFYKHAGDFYRRNCSIAPVMWATVSKLLALGISILLVVSVAGTPLLALILGSSWRVDTTYIMLVLLPVIFRMVVSPITSVFPICNRMILCGGWQTLYFVWSLIILYFSSKYLDIDNFLIVLAISEFIMYATYLMFANIAVNNPYRKLELD